jgi:hypothetical protein
MINYISGAEGNEIEMTGGGPDLSVSFGRPWPAFILFFIQENK